MVYQYKWKGTSFPISAQVAGEYMHNLSESSGGLTARRLLEESRDENALMHNCFEWDDTKAAEAHRISQARYMIRTCVCTIVDDGGEKKSEDVRAFVSVSETKHAERGIYQPVVKALSNSDSRAIVLENAKRDLISFKQKYATLSELSDVLTAIDEYLEETKVG